MHWTARTLRHHDGIGLIAISLFFSSKLCNAGEELNSTSNGGLRDVPPYIFNYKTLSPIYVVILFPGGNGNVDPHIEDGK